MFKIIQAHRDLARMSLTAELIYIWGPILEGRLPVFGEDQKTILTPRVSIVENTKEIQIIAELPGVEENDIRVNVTRDGLSISGGKKRPVDKKGNSSNFMESLGGFQRLVVLPQDVDRKKAQATFRKGILKVVLPKKVEEV